MGFIIEFSYLGGPTLYKRSCHPNFPEQNTHDPSLTMCWTWHHHILSVPLSPSGSFKRRPARSWCQCAATKSFVVRCDGRCTTCRMPGGAVDCWSGPSLGKTINKGNINKGNQSLVSLDMLIYFVDLVFSGKNHLWESRKGKKDQEITPMADQKLLPGAPMDPQNVDICGPLEGIQNCRHQIGYPLVL